MALLTDTRYVCIYRRYSVFLDLNMYLDVMYIAFRYIVLLSYYRSKYQSR
jgi:hypothetical protein